MNELQLEKLAQSYTNKKYNREKASLAAKEIVAEIIANLNEYEEAYGITEIDELVCAVANDVVNS